MLEKWFKLKENNTTAKTEVMAGITTFMTMAYILAVNPTMLAAAGMDKTAVLIATALASFIGAPCKLSVCTGTGDGTECVFCIHGLRCDGIFLAGSFNGCFCGRSGFHRTFFDQCA